MIMYRVVMAVMVTGTAVGAAFGVARADLAPARVQQYRAVLDALVHPPSHRALEVGRDRRDHLDHDPATLWLTL